MSTEDAETKPSRGRVSPTSRSVLCVLVGVLWSSGLLAQSPEEHASHHPGQSGSAMSTAGPMPAGGATPATSAMPGGAGTMGGKPGMEGPPEGAGGGPPEGAGGMMGGGMGDMMKGMGAPKPKDFYPTLMNLPDMPLAMRLEVEQQANGRMRSAVVLMNDSLDDLLQAAAAQNYTAMQAGTASLREGLAQFESGLAAQRALAEGKAPRNVALTWFKRDMNLLPLPGTNTNAIGLGVFHWFIMVLLASFFVVMSGMYFFKMRRASALLQRIVDGGSANPPAVAAKKPAAPPEKTALATDNPVANAPAKTVGPSAAAPPAGTASSGWRGVLRASRIFDETPGVKTFRFTAMDGGPIPFTYLPGQFLTIFPVIDGRRTPRCYTIASSPTQHHYCELTIKREEKGKGVSKYMHDGLQEGELLEASGPSGKFVFTGAEAKNVVLIGGGVGITPLMSYVRYLTDIGWPGHIFFLYTCRHASEYIFRPELERLCARHPKLHLIVTITRPNEEPWSGLTGRLTKELIAHHVPNIDTRLVYVCGPNPMMRAAQAALLELEVPAAQVKTEAFGAAQSASAEDGKKPSDAVAEAPPEAAARPAAEAALETPPIAAEAAPTAGDGAAAKPAVSVTFKKSGKDAPLPPNKSILEASEDVGVDLDFQCRTGTCGECKVKLISGAVTMEVEDALSAEEKASGMVLACQAKSTSNCAVDA